MAAALASGLCAATALMACSAEAPSQEEIRSGLVDSGVSEDLATCAAKALDENLTDEQLANITERGGGGAPVDDPERDDDASDKVRAALSDCRVAADATSTTIAVVTTTGPSTTAAVPSTDGASIDTSEP